MLALYPQERLVINEFEHYLRNERSLSPLSTRCYRKDADQFQDFMKCRNKTIVAATREDIQSFIDEISQCHKASTVARKFATLSTLFKWAVKAGECKESPIPPCRKGKNHGFQLPRVETAKRTNLSDADCDKLLSNLNRMDETLEWRDKAIYSLILFCGIRASELQAANFGDVCIASRTMVINRRTSGLSRRVIRDITNVLAVVSHYLTLRSIGCQPAPEEPLFINRTSSRISDRSIRRNLAKQASNAGLDSISPMDLLHTFAVKSLQEGTRIEDLQDHLGHLSVATTRLYLPPKKESNEPPLEEVSECCEYSR